MPLRAQGQQLRFRVLSGILTDLRPSASVSINDFGCGYGALYDFLLKVPSMGELSYFGYDISKDMIDTAKKCKYDSGATFRKASKIDTSADYTFVSGTFNLNLDVDDHLWGTYVKSTLSQLWSKSESPRAQRLLHRFRLRNR